MHRIFAITVILALTGCGRPIYKSKSDAETDAFHASPRRVTETFFENPPQDGSVPAKMAMFDVRTIMEFNEVGNIVRIDRFVDADTVHIACEEYSFDTTGTRLQCFRESDPHSDRTIKEIVYGYDEQDRLIEEKEMAGGNNRAEITYDKQGYPQFRSGDGMHLRYRYDMRGRLRRERYKNRIVPENYSEEELGRVNRYIKKYAWRTDGTLRRVTLRGSDRDLYDEKGNLVSATSIVKNRNERGRVTKRILVTIAAEYEYDAYGNWTRRTQMYNGEIQSAAVRELEYYNTVPTHNVSWRKVDDHWERKNSITVSASLTGFSSYNAMWLPNEPQFGLEYDRVVYQNLSVSALLQRAPLNANAHTDDYYSDLKEILWFVGAKVNYNLPVVRNWLYFRAGFGGGVGFHNATGGDASYVKPHFIADLHWIFRVSKGLELRFAPAIVSPSQVIFGSNFNHRNQLYANFDMFTFGASVRF